MKILIIGFVALSAWSSFATYLYVCKIKGLCDGPIAMQITSTKVINDIAPEPAKKPLVQEKISAPKDLTTYFAFDKSDFNSNAVTDKFFDESNAYLNQNSQAMLSITGYTDAIGTDEYNLALGYRRAQSLQHYLENKGILENKILIVSKGEKEPADENNTSAGRANNRRTIITINK
jgi:outer membrane protein OmpA-like peptidoglycan-associated protein